MGGSQMSEESLKSTIRRGLADDFLLREEVKGYNAFYEKEVWADFLAYPRQPLVETGFQPAWFAVESKWIAGVHGQTSKSTRAVWQTLTYAQSHFQVDGTQVLPGFVLLFTPARLHHAIEQHLKTLMGLAYYGNVGTLYFYRGGDWGIKFAYLYSRRQDGDFVVKANKLPRRRAGNV